MNQSFMTSIINSTGDANPSYLIFLLIFFSIVHVWAFILVFCVEFVFIEVFILTGRPFFEIVGTALIIQWGCLSSILHYLEYVCGNIIIYWFSLVIWFHILFSIQWYSQDHCFLFSRVIKTIVFYSVV